MSKQTNESTPSPNDFTDLLDLAATGDQQAAQELHDRFAETVIRTADYRLARIKCLRTLYDSTDFTQEAWADFFKDIAEGKKFASPQAMMCFLNALIMNRVNKTARMYLGTQKRDLRCERHLGDPSIAGAARTLTDPHPTPAHEAESIDLFKHWFQQLKPQQRQIVLHYQAGFTSAEIAAEFDCSLRSIQIEGHIVGRLVCQHEGRG